MVSRDFMEWDGLEVSFAARRRVMGIRYFIIIIIIIIKNEKIRVTLCGNAAGELYIVNSGR